MMFSQWRKFQEFDERFVCFKHDVMIQNIAFGNYVDV